MNMEPASLHARALPRRLGVRAETRQPWTAALIVDVMRRRALLVLGILAACLGSAVAYLGVAEPRFTATSALVIDTRMTPPSPAQAQADVAVDPAVIESQIEILRSSKIAFDVIDRLSLERDPEFGAPRPDRLSAILAPLEDLLGSDEGSRTPADPRQVAAGALERAVKISRSGRSFIAEIKVTSRDPAKSASIANTFAEAYVRDQLSSRLESGQRTIDFMQQRLKEVRETTEEAERALGAFRGGGRTSADATAARAETEQARARIASTAQAQRPAGPSDPAPSALTALESLGGGSATRIAGDLRARSDEAGALQQRLEKLASEQRGALAAAEARGAAPGDDAARAARERQLSLAAQDARGTYDALQNRVMRMSAFIQQQAVPVTEARVVTVAAPPLAKSAPRTALVLLLASVGGAAAGAAGALLREMTDRRIRWPDQVTEELGLCFLGPLPTMKGHGLVAPGDGRRIGRRPLSLPLLVSGRAGSLAALETLRSTKVLVDQALGRERGRVVGIVSANRREGKSTLAVNFAALATEVGSRVLLVDANLDEGGLTALLAGPDSVPLATAVAEMRGLEACVVRTSLGFDIMPGTVGAPPAHPAEILASAALRGLLAQAREAYDYVVVEIPAVLDVVDARALADAVDLFIVAAAAGRTTTTEVESMFAACPLLSERAVGLVLNGSRLPARRGRNAAPRARLAMAAR